MTYGLKPAYPRWAGRRKQSPKLVARDAAIVREVKAGKHVTAIGERYGLTCERVIQIAKEAGIPLGELDPVGGVSGRDSYEALLLWNADQLEKALK